MKKLSTKSGLYVLSVFALLISQTTFSQNNKGVSEVNTKIEPVQGQVNSITVLENSPGNIKLALDFTELNNHDYELVAELTDKNRAIQEHIKSLKVNLKDAKSPLILDFNLNSDVVLDSQMVSSFLEIKVGPKNSYKEMSHYELNKRWNPQVINDMNSVAVVVGEE